LRATQLADRSARTGAAGSLTSSPLAGRILSEPETALLFSLLDVALGARVPVSGRVPATGSTLGVRLTLVPQEQSTAVETVRGVLRLDRMALTVSASGPDRVGSR
jgi:hypothetical protein